MPIEEINEAMATIQYRKKHKLKIEAEYRGLSAEQAKKEKILKMLHQKMKQELKEFERLDKISIFNLYYTLKGNKKEKLKKEEVEYIAVREEYEEAQQDLAPVLERQRIINLLLNEYKTIDEDYENLLVRKENYLKFHESAHTPELESIRTQLLPLRIELRELEEAFELGNSIAMQAGSLRMLLAKANNFGSVDDDGNFYLGFSEEHKLKQMKLKISQLQLQLDRYNKELEDTKLRLKIYISLATKNTGFFVNNLRWHVKSSYHMHQMVAVAMAQIGTLQNQLRDYQKMLRNELGKAKNKISELTQRRLRILEQ